MTREPAERCVIPLMIKKYKGGQFTTAFLRDDFEGTVHVSRSRGRGLSLQDMPDGRIVLMAGGTGLFPFCDLIDLLYKSFLIENKHPRSQEFMEYDPILRQKPFNRFEFVLYMAVDYLD